MATPAQSLSQSTGNPNPHSCWKLLPKGQYRCLDNLNMYMKMLSIFRLSNKLLWLLSFAPSLPMVSTILHSLKLFPEWQIHLPKQLKSSMRARATSPHSLASCRARQSPTRGRLRLYPMTSYCLTAATQPSGPPLGPEGGCDAHSSEGADSCPWGVGLGRLMTPE